MRPFTKCLYCQRPLDSSLRKKYCARECSVEHKYHLYIDDWKRGDVDGGNSYVSSYVRRYLKQDVGYCQECGYKDQSGSLHSTLEIHHIDGDNTNHQYDNLQVLCRNCHSNTDNFKSLNRGANHV